MKLFTGIAVVVLLIAGGTGAVYAFNKHHDWGMSAEEKADFVTDRVTRKLDLDDQQRQKFSELAKYVFKSREVNIKARLHSSEAHSYSWSSSSSTHHRVEASWREVRDLVCSCQILQEGRIC